MSGHRKWEDIRGEMTPARRAKVDQIKRAMEEGQRLYDLRLARGLTQIDLAEALGLSQSRVSRIEHGEEPHLSTVRRYVEALGGRLELRAVFDDEAVELTV